jgi:hypothetical protein
MMYLPYKSDQREEAIKLMVDIFALVLPEKVAEEVVRKDVKLTYDPATDELVQIVMPFETKTEVTTLTVDKGWITEASIEDVKLLPGVRRTMFRLQGCGSVGRAIAMAGRVSRESSTARRRTALTRTAKPCGPGTRCWCQVGGGVSAQPGADKLLIRRRR